MTKASTKRKHSRKCERCRRRYTAPTWLHANATGNHCPKCLQKMGVPVEYGAGCLNVTKA